MRSMSLWEHHDILSRLAEVGIVAGNGVRLTQDIERYPHALIKAGETGTITEVVEGFVSIKLSVQHDGLAEWDNHLHINYDQVPEEIDELKTLQILTDEMPEVG